MAQFLSHRLQALKSRPAKLAASALLLAIIVLVIWLIASALRAAAGALPDPLPVPLLRRADGQRPLPDERRRRLHRLRRRVHVAEQLRVERLQRAAAGR